MKTSLRSQKLAGVIEEKLPRIIHQILSPDRIGFLTITALEVSGDLGVADVFVRSLNGPSSFLKKLKKTTPKIEYELLRHLSLRRPIKLRFKLDKSVEYVENLEKLL